MLPVIIAIGVLVLLAFVLLVGVARRNDTGEAIGALSRETRKRDKSSPPPMTAESQSSSRELERAASRQWAGKAVVVAGPAPAPAPFVAPDAEAISVTRRQFFNRSIIVLFILGLSTFGAAIIAFLWPNVSGGFGSKIRVGKVSDVLSDIEAADGFLYVPEGRAWLTAYPAGAIPKAKLVYPDSILSGMEAGVVALYQKCPHLGCRVPDCQTSQWFECPCHGSQFNQAGEKKGGPAPRGMDRFGTEVTGGVLVVNTGLIVPGPTIGTNTTGQEAEGPHCVSGGH